MNIEHAEEGSGRSIVMLIVAAILLFTTIIFSLGIRSIDRDAQHDASILSIDILNLQDSVHKLHIKQTP